MKIEVLYFDGCPNHRPAVDLVRSVAPDATVEEIEICTPEDAERMRFVGSPSIRVDGVDVEPAARTRTDYGFSCRTYNGRGLPSRETVAAAVAPHGGCCGVPQPENTRGLWLAAGSVASAVVASACCWLPLLLLAFGASAAGISAAFETVRPWFLGGAALLLGVGFYSAYRKESCCAPRSRRRNRAILWATTLAVLAFALFPSYAGLLYESTSGGSAPASGPAVTLEIEGMTCEGCAALLESALADLPGVKSASVSYADGRAVVIPDPASPAGRAAMIAVVEKGGYTLRSDVKGGHSP